MRCIFQMTAIFLLIHGAASLHGQLATTTATLSGTVLDSSGAAVPQANLTLTGTENGIVRTYVTDAAGHYLFSQLPPAQYVLNVKMTGFKEYKQNGIVLSAGNSATQDVKLEIGSTTQEVQVTAQASLLNTDNANISADINSKQVVELPLNLRNVYGLATLNSSVNNTLEQQALLGGSGASNDNADQDISFLNFGGGFFGTSAYLLDGVWDTDPEWGAVLYVPSVDAVEEFKIQNNSFTSQYGWSTGNVVNVVSKSGTSAFHGDAYEFYRNAALDSNLWFNNHNGIARSDFDRNQFGGSAGGPLYIPGLYRQKNKTFIFGLIERLSLSSPSTGTFTVPTQQYLTGDFSGLLGAQRGTDALGRPVYVGQIYDPRSTRMITAGQVDPVTGLKASQTGYIRDPIANNNLNTLGAVDSVASKILSYYPSATAGGATNNYVASANNPAHSTEYLIRVDHNINDLARFYVRYSYKSEFKTGNPDYWGSSNPAGPGDEKPNNRWNLSAGYTQIFSPTFTMIAQAGVSIWHETSVNQSAGFLPSSLGLPSYLDTNSPEFPVVTIGSQSPLGPEQYQGIVNHGPIGSVSVDFIKNKGKHTINFGGMFIEQQDDEHQIYQASLKSTGTFTLGPDPNNPESFTTGNGLAQFMLGVLDGGAAGIANNPAVASQNYGWYIQDDWKPTQKLTLNLGFRYEIQTPVTYRHDQAAVFNPAVVNPISSQIGETVNGALQYLSSDNRGSFNTNYKNFAPRFGFTYQARPNVVMRGGFGIFYPQSINCCFSATGAGYSSETDVESTIDGISANPAVTTTNPWPYGYIPLSGNTNGELQNVGESVGSNFRSRKSPYVEQYLMGVQWAITPNDSLDVNYVGNHGVHMVQSSVARNQLNPVYLALGQADLTSQVPNPYYGHITQSSCALNEPTVEKYQLLTSYPQYCGVSEVNAPIGFSNYNALQAAFNHRTSFGLTAQVSYTYSKFLDNVEGNNQWNFAGPANYWNFAGEKSVDGNDVPHSLVANYIYDLPFGRGRRFASGMNRTEDLVLGGWEVSQIATFRQGIPLGMTGNDIASYGGAPRPDVSGDTHVSHPTINEWFNTAAFSYAPFGTFGNTPRYFSTLRGPGYQNWDTSLMKNWKVKENMRVQFRAELYNTFNHPQFYTPSTSYTGCDPNAESSCSSGFGKITSAFDARTVQFAGKFYW
ncbi:TonB-dependent receptor domain-containing protein [Silvibacterium acidisoli]|uniref:TonB-dependent receptor domain-containing protein n=1 Tax=Acidobacteriaceae bacterium ZG23-2 TaxID=2883246 RepID=UPI00406C503B